MIRFLLLALLTSTFLSACGGGGAGSSTTVASVTTTTLAKPVTAKLGDFYSYKYVSSLTAPRTGDPITSFFTDVYTAINSDESYTLTNYSSFSSIPKWNHNYSAKGVETSSNSVDLQQKCTYDPKFGEAQIPVSVGQTWDVTNISICDGSNSGDQETSVGSVIGIETVVVAAGSFNAWKIAYKYKFKTSDFVMTIDSTCWIAISLGRRVKCVNTTSVDFPSTPGENSASKSTSELVAYTVGGVPQKLPPAGSYAGDWSGTYQGQDSGQCKVLISTDGALTGSCTGGMAGTFTIAGNVGDSQNISFNISSGGVAGPAFSGQFSSLTSLTGTWSTTTGLSGTWSISHT